MRVSSIKLNEVKEIVKSLQGKTIEMIINRGRNKLVTLDAVIDKVYPSMFIIKPLDMVELDRTSFSYSDLLCGDIKFLIDNVVQN
ncbi:MAG: Veg family protein [Clostridia bacterium]|nr:Veg family protein [Clostridia bacterium]